MDQTLRQFAREVLDAEADAVRQMHAAIDDDFEAAVRLILDSTGHLITCGVGKAGHVARKLSATLASTGTPSHFLSPGDALHGDLGSVREGDLVLLISGSGETDEILRILSVVRQLGHKTLAMTRDASTSLGRDADLVLKLGKVEEACPLKLAPTCSTTAMLALGDALALTVMQERGFTASDFARYHPAGQLGRKLLRVEEAMTFRLGENLPTATPEDSVAETLRRVSRISRRPGAILVINDRQELVGLFSDGDLRRLITSEPEIALQKTMRDVMTPSPKSIEASRLAADAMAVMRQHRIDELPVVDDFGKCVGLIDVQDLVALKLYDSEKTR